MRQQGISGNISDESMRIQGSPARTPARSCCQFSSFADEQQAGFAVLQDVAHVVGRLNNDVALKFVAA